MKIYTIANKGIVDHGQSGHKWTFRICRSGVDEDGDFPPVFKTQKIAQTYLNELKGWSGDKQIVELELVD